MPCGILFAPCFPFIAGYEEREPGDQCCQVTTSNLVILHDFTVSLVGFTTDNILSSKQMRKSNSCLFYSSLIPPYDYFLRVDRFDRDRADLTSLLTRKVA